MVGTTARSAEVLGEGAEAAKAAGIPKLAKLLETIAGASDYLGLDVVVDEYLERLTSHGLSVAHSITRHEGVIS
jgi:hypothetical protein